MKSLVLPAAILLGCLAPDAIRAQRAPNLIVVFCDDLGYGDLGCFGHPTIRTPSIDRMAREGQRWTDFYVPESVCTPSRAALLTGRLPRRTGMCGDEYRVLFPFSAGGLPDAEVTLAEMLRDAGYATACVGKWHLGHRPEFLPMRHGFDLWFGIPYSNDMNVAQRGDPPIPLMRGGVVVEQPADLRTVTTRYTDEAVAFIRANQHTPFFLYLAHTFPHVPLFASPAQAGQSPRGLYGDAVEEIDTSIGRVLDEVRALGLESDTLVVFSSDNGPWLPFREHGGSAGMLREGKGSCWDGGVRVPTIAWRPGTVPAASVQRGIGSVLDLLPTFAAMANVQPPAGVSLDGIDLSDAFGGGTSARNQMPFYRGTRLLAFREGPFKLHVATCTTVDGVPVAHDPPLLFHLGQDPSERNDLAAAQPQIVERMLASVQKLNLTVPIGGDQLSR